MCDRACESTLVQVASKEGGRGSLPGAQDRQDRQGYKATERHTSRPEVISLDKRCYSCCSQSQMVMAGFKPGAPM